ncbi:MAG TPA: hypothetical protein VF669_22445 [Tepidisphaeraceae bacterium]|jgi:hypothetical protein
MNRRELWPPTSKLTVGLLICLLTSSIWATPIPDATKSLAALTPADTTAISSALQSSIEALVQGTPRAREDLIGNALIGGQLNAGASTASPAFLSALATELDKQLLPLAKNQNLTIRLNAAIVAARVAQYANNAQLANTVLAFVNDQAEPVTLWGVRGARWIIPNLLGGPFANPKHQLISAVVNAVKAHPEGIAAGWIASDAYEALGLDLNDPNRAKKVTPAMIAGTVEPMQNLLAVRADLYKTQVPANTVADRSGMNYLVNARVWTAQNAQQQTRTVQLLSDLMSLAVQQAVAQAQANNASDASELLLTVSQAAKALSVAAAGAQEPALNNAVTPATAIGKTTSAEQAASLVNAVFPAIRTSAKFKTVNEPPKIQGTKAAPPTTLAPTTMPEGGTPPPPPPPPPPPTGGGTTGLPGATIPPVPGQTGPRPAPPGPR